MNSTKYLFPNGPKDQLYVISRIQDGERKGNLTKLKLNNPHCLDTGIRFQFDPTCPEAKANAYCELNCTVSY